MNYNVLVAREGLEYPPGGVLLEKLGRGVRPASQNPYPFYDQNGDFSYPIYDLTKNLIPYL